MKIAYVTTYDSADKHAWSGIGNCMLTAIDKPGFEIELIGNLREERTNLYRSKKALIKISTSQNYIRSREPAILKSYARQVEKALSSIDVDLIFSPGTIPIAYLNTDIPIVFWTDATFAGMIDYYTDFSNLYRTTIRDGNYMEQLALKKCKLAIYASSWAAQTAVKYYDVDPDKVKVVPFGANLESGYSIEDVQSIIENKKQDVCRLLFVGVDWGRKGGDIAVQVTDILNNRGIKTELHVVGCQPKLPSSESIVLHGFISKKSKEGIKELEKLFIESHFLLLPSQAECFGIVFAEASSYGLPSLATSTGGIPSAIIDGKNGYTFNKTADPEEYCDCIEELFLNKNKYNELAKSAYNEFKTRLNWSVAGDRILDLIYPKV